MPYTSNHLCFYEQLGKKKRDKNEKVLIDNFHTVCGDGVVLITNIALIYFRENDK
jgi:hypothetical protein